MIKIFKVANELCLIKFEQDEECGGMRLEYATLFSLRVHRLMIGMNDVRRYKMCPLNMFLF